jgi:hypothetical protein
MQTISPSPRNKSIIQRPLYPCLILRELKWVIKTKTPKKNRLLQKGALTFPHPFKDAPVKLPDWIKAKAANFPSMPSQPDLF